MKPKLLLLTATALVLMSCGGPAAEEADDPAPKSPEVHRTIEVSMTDFAFEPSSVEVTSGETVEFVVANEGAVEHEFRLTSHHDVEDHMSNGHADHEESTDHDMMVLVPAGETDSLSVTFADTGEIELYACLLPGHYEAGMEGELLIEG